MAEGRIASAPPQAAQTWDARLRSRGLTAATFLVAAGALSLAVVQVARLPFERVWTTDDGNKYLVTRSTAAGSWWRPTLPYPGRRLDPEVRWAPIAPPFATVHDGQLVSVYPPAFPLVSAIFYRALGPPGLYVLPLLGGLLTLLGTAALAVELGASPALAVAFAGPLSFHFFYWTILWEHTATTGLAVWSVVAVLRGLDRHGARAPIAAGVLLGVGTWLRDELLVAFAAMTLTCLAERALRRSLPRFVAAYLVIWLPAALWRTLLAGSPVGSHGSANVRAAHWAGAGGLHLFHRDALEVLYTLFFSASAGFSQSLLLVAGPVAALLALALAPRWLRRWPVIGPLALAVTAGSALLSLALLRWTPAPAMTLIQVSGLLVFAPWVVLAAGAFLSDRPISADPERANLSALRDGRLRWLVTFVALFVLGLAFVLRPPGVHGVHWGPRALSPLVPVFATLAALGVDRLLRHTRALAGTRWTWWTQAALAAVVGAALLIQLEGLHLQGQVAAALGIFTAARATDTPLVTDLWWYGQLTAPASLTRPTYLILSRRELAAWLARYADAGGRRFEYATQRSLDGLAPGLPVRQTSARVVSADGLGPLTHQIVTFELLRPGADAGTWQGARESVAGTGH